MQSGQTPTYQELLDILQQNRDSPVALSHTLGELEDAGVQWLAEAFADLRWSLALGQLERAERLLDLLEAAARVADRTNGAFRQVNEVRSELRVLVNGVAAILDGHVEAGAAEIDRLLKWRDLPGGLSWVGTVWMASASQYAGDMSRALELARRALEMARTLDARATGLTLNMLGELYYAAGFDHRALAFLEQAETAFRTIDAPVSLASVLLSRARLLVSMGEEEAAIAAAEAAAEHFLDWEAPLLFLGWQHLRRGDPDRAEDTVRPLTALVAPPQELPHLLAAVRAAREGRVDPEVLREFIGLRDRPPGLEVNAALEALAERAPGFQPLREQLAWHLFHSGDFTQAGQAFSDLAREGLDPGLRPSVLLGLGCLASRSSRGRATGARVHAAAHAAESSVHQEEDEVRTRVASPSELGLVRESNPGGHESKPAGLAQKAEESREVELVTLDAFMRVTFNGDLAQMPVPELIQFLANGRRTGTLVISSEHGIGVVHLLSGQVTGAASPKCPNIGDILLAEGSITPEQLRQAAAAQQKALTGMLLGAILIIHGGVDILLVQKALQMQVVHAVREMLSWSTGRFAFEPDPPVQDEDEPAPAPDVLLDAQWVLLEACRLEDEMAREG